MKKSLLLSLMIFITVNLSSQTWVEQVSGVTVNLRSISAADDNIAWVCGSSGTVLKTTNKGVNWLNVSGNISTVADLLNIFGQDENNALVTGIFSGGITSIYHTSNGGLNWTQTSVHSGLGDFLWKTSSTDAYFIGDVTSGNWDLLKSTNGGLNWFVWSVLPGNANQGSYVNGPCFRGQQVWFGATGGSKIFYSSNLGTNWIAQTVPLNGIGIICFSSDTKGMAAGLNSSSLLLTTNSGTNWVPVTNPYSGANISGMCYMNSTWWVAKGFQIPGEISFSTNDGANWLNSYSVANRSFGGMSKSRSGNTMWIVGINGHISRYGTIIGINPNSTEIPESFSLKQNYPNPFNPETTIEFQIPEKNFVSIKIFDCLGKEISTLVSEFLEPGSFSTSFNAAGLPGGIYFLRMVSGVFSETKKMILVK